ncbi:MAG: OmpA family protein, partial [Desulfobacterales bacterium]|nr:OmpA family protein [Desulfobacterales bacterium]
MKKGIIPLAFLVLFGLCSLDCIAEEALQVTSTANVANLSFQIIKGEEEGAKELLVTALDADDAPVRGLTAEDVVIKLGRKKAKILSFESLETSEKVGLNIVMVVDNSASMKKRKAIEPLLTAMEEFYKIIRPIDSIHMIVFDNDNTMKIGGRDLHVKILESNDITRLQSFLGEAFDKGLSVKTTLYEAMAAGLNITREMPEDANKFMVVFTDGEDINSAFKSDVVEAEAKDIPNFEAYVVDYMPGDKPNAFLEAFAKTHGGRLWKATASKDLLPIFQSFSTRLLYRYVATYRFLDPPTGAVSMKPAELDLQLFTMLDGSPLKNALFFQSGKSDITPPYVLLADREEAGAFDAASLENALDRYLNILNIIGKDMAGDPNLTIGVKGFNDGQGVEKENLDLSSGRADAVKTYLRDIWGVDESRVRTEAGNLPENAAPSDVLGGNAENRRVEISFDSPDMEARVAGAFIDEISRVAEIQVAPRVEAEYGVADWELVIWGDAERIAEVKGEGPPEEGYQFSLDDLDKQKLAAFKQLQTKIKVADINGDAYETDAALCDVRVSRREIIHGVLRPPSGSL